MIQIFLKNTFLALGQLWNVTSFKRKKYLFIGFIVFAISLTGFIQLVDEVIEGDTLPFDTTILYTIRSLHNHILDLLVPFITEFGGVFGVISIILIVSTVLIVKKYYRKTVYLLYAVGGAALFNIILKLLFQRDRPELWQRIVTENGYSFPSGHAMASMALAASVIILLWKTKYRMVAIIIGGLYILTIGLTRMYLGVHYPSDILAGWLISLAWVVVVTFILRKQL